MAKIVPVLVNIRSIHNVGSILRTCDGLGVGQVFTVGITPHPRQPADSRLPHVIARVHRQLAKTALGAEKSITCRHFSTFSDVIITCRQRGMSLVALEHTPVALKISDFKLPGDTALILGAERDGLAQSVIDECDSVIHIPMHGQKSSFNVSVAAALAMYDLTRR